MKIEQKLIDEADHYFKKLAEFTQNQQEKVSSLIAENHKVIDEAKALTQTEKMDSQLDELIQRVNNDLDNAMTEVNERMKLSTQTPAEAGSTL